MMQNVFRKFKNNFSNKFKLNNQKNSQQKYSEKENQTSINKFKTIKIDGNQFDINSLDKESKNILELYEMSNMKIKFFENLLKQMKVNRNLKIIELKSKLKKENTVT